MVGLFTDRNRGDRCWWCWPCRQTGTYRTVDAGQPTAVSLSPLIHGQFHSIFYWLLLSNQVLIVSQLLIFNSDSSLELSFIDCWISISCRFLDELLIFNPSSIDQLNSVDTYFLISYRFPIEYYFQSAVDFEFQSAAFTYLLLNIGLQSIVDLHWIVSFQPNLLLGINNRMSRQ